MNKKFSTLVASLLLATTVGTASAVDVPNFVKVAQPETAGDYNAETYYQLTSGQEVLVMEKTDAGFILKLLPYAEADLANSLWVIEPSTNTDDEGGLSFRFKNKRYGIYLSYNAKDASVTTATDASMAPGNISVWKWAEALEGGKFSNGATIKATFGAQKDSVVYLSELSDGSIAAMKEATKNHYSSITLVPKTAGVVRLGVDDLNSMLGMQDFTTGKLKMNFTPETTGENLFTKNEYRAVAAAGTNSYTQSSLKFATEAVEYWETEIKEIEAAFAKIGTMKEYEAAKARLDKLEAALLPAGQHNALCDKVEELQVLLKKQKDAVNTAIEAYTGTDNDVKQGLSSLKTVLANVDKAEEAKNKNLADLALYESAKAAILEGRNENAKDVYEDLLAEYWAAKEGYQTTVEEYGVAKELVNSNLNALKSLVENQDLDLSTVEAVLAKYEANVAYLNNINLAIKELRVGASAVVFDLLADIAEVEGMTIKPLKAYKGNGYNYVKVDEYKATNAEFVQCQEALDTELREALDGVLTAYDGQKTEILSAYADSKSAWDDVVGKVNDLTTASNNHFVNLGGHITALYWALEQNATNLATVEANIEANKKAQENLDKEYSDLVVARNNVYATLVGFTGANADAVKSIIAAYNAQIATYEELVAVKDRLATSNINNGKFTTASIDFGYFRLAKLELDWSREMESMWLIEKAYWNAEVAQWVSLKYADNKYLMVDTAYMTQAAGDQYQTFACNKTFKEIKGWSPAAHDINGRINFRFFYFPSQDSLLIESEGGALKKVDTKYWTDMTPEEVRQGQFGNLVMVKVLADTREVTIQRYEIIKGVHNIPTINTRIGFATAATQAIEQIPSGVYLIKKVTTDPDKNGKYAVDNFLGTWGFGITAQKNQDFQHIPAAQWVVVAEEKATTNSIYNRESGDALDILTPTVFENVQFYTDAQNNIFTMTGDTLEFVPVTDVTTPELGYLAVDKIEGEDADYTYYSFNLINGLATDLSIAADAKGNLKVAGEPTYFTVTPGKTVEYGYAKENVAVQLKRTPYTISLDGKFVNKNADGMYVLSDAPAYFFFKEFKQDADSVCHYALISTNGEDKVGVDYTSTLLVNEDLEDATVDYTNENTATFALTKKEIERYRNVTAEPAYKQFYQADNQESIILCENPENKSAGTTANPSKPTGINFLGQSANDFSIYVDTAYVRNETKRPQYLLGLRPDFTPMEVPCPEDSPEHNHPATYVPQTAAEYLIVVNDSLANADADEKMYLSKEGYTRLAFVAATHRNDSLIMASDNNRIFLGNNARNNVTFQFLYAERPALEDSEDFYIETQVGAKKGWIKILNAIPVIVDNLQDADIFNVEEGKTVANENVTVSSISVIAGNGTVTVKGAAGKKVAISNVLGQTIANTVVTSDEATIAAPAGVVVVAVEGEAAVKAIVK